MSQTTLTAKTTGFDCGCTDLETCGECSLKTARAYARLSCQGKADADAFFGEDLSDVSRGVCGLVHTGACNPAGESFYR